MSESKFLEEIQKMKKDFSATKGYILIPWDMIRLVNKVKKDFPKSEVWERFMKEMFNDDGSYKVDIWSDILDHKDIDNILDWIIQFMKIHKKWFGKFK